MSAVCVETTLLRAIWEAAPRYTKPQQPASPTFFHPKKKYTPRKDAKKHRDIEVKRITFERTTRLIVPALTYCDNVGDLHNGHWAYNVPYAFRDALDIKYEKRAKTTTHFDKQGQEQTRQQLYMTWTQGCLLNFTLGDMFESARGDPWLQVKDAVPMCWDSDIGVMNEGSVTYHLIQQQYQPSITVSQVDFLRVLIHGEKVLNIDVWRGLDYCE